MTKYYFYNTKVNNDGSITLLFKHDIPQKTRIKIARKIQRKGKRMVRLYPDGRLEVFKRIKS